MDTFLSRIEGRIRERQAELAELQTARRVYISLNSEPTPQVATSSQSSSSTETRQVIGQNQSPTVAAALRAAA